MEKRSQWASSLGFLLATAGAAIGLGNLWKFPYLMGRNGGFTFLIIYLIFVVVLGIPVMITEMAVGRSTQKSAVAAYHKLGGKKAAVIGVLGVLAAFLILSYYSVIGGWIIKYIVSYATTLSAPADFAAYTAQTWEPILWHLVFMAMTIVICYVGTKGIEKVSKVMMPGLFILLLVLIVRSVTLPGAEKGLAFIFQPSGEGLTFSAINAALGQVFYSLSLAMGITLTYGSYLQKKENIPGNCAKIAGMDTMAAVMAGVAIFPAVFSFGLEPTQGPVLIFDTLPQVFANIPAGSAFAILFFVLMLFAAVTSSIALLECVSSFAMDNFHWSRRKATVILGVLIALLGIPSSLSFGVLSDLSILGYNFFDFICMITDNILLPLGGLLMCIFVGWVWGPKMLVEEIESEGVKFRLKKAWIWCIRLVTPVLIAVVMIGGFVSIYQVVTGAR